MLSQLQSDILGRIRSQHAFIGLDRCGTVALLQKPWTTPFSQAARRLHEIFHDTEPHPCPVWFLDELLEEMAWEHGERRRRSDWLMRYVASQGSRIYPAVPFHMGDDSQWDIRDPMSRFIVLGDQIQGELPKFIETVATMCDARLARFVAFELRVLAPARLRFVNREVLIRFLRTSGANAAQAHSFCQVELRKAYEDEFFGQLRYFGLSSAYARGVFEDIFSTQPERGTLPSIRHLRLGDHLVEWAPSLAAFPPEARRSPNRPAGAENRAFPADCQWLPWFQGPWSRQLYFIAAFAELHHQICTVLLLCKRERLKADVTQRILDMIVDVRKPPRKLRLELATTQLASMNVRFQWSLTCRPSEQMRTWIIHNREPMGGINAHLHAIADQVQGRREVLNRVRRALQALRFSSDSHESFNNIQALISTEPSYFSSPVLRLNLPPDHFGHGRVDPLRLIEVTSFDLTLPSIRDYVDAPLNDGAARLIAVITSSIEGQVPGCNIFPWIPVVSKETFSVVTTRKFKKVVLCGLCSLRGLGIRGPLGWKIVQWWCHWEVVRPERVEKLERVERLATLFDFNIRHGGGNALGAANMEPWTYEYVVNHKEPLEGIEAYCLAIRDAILARRERLDALPALALEFGLILDPWLLTELREWIRKPVMQLTEREEVNRERFLRRPGHHNLLWHFHPGHRLIRPILEHTNLNLDTDLTFSQLFQRALFDGTIPSRRAMIHVVHSAAERASMNVIVWMRPVTHANFAEAVVPTFRQWCLFVLWTLQRGNMALVPTHLRLPSELRSKILTYLV